MADNHGERLSIGKIRVTQTAGESRVEALVDGTPLWFASPDASFRVSSEGFLSAMLLPAMTTRRPLAAIDAACDVWLDNAGGAIDLFRQFRRLDAIDVIAPRLASVAATPPAGAAPGTAKVDVLYLATRAAGTELHRASWAEWGGSPRVDEALTRARFAVTAFVPSAGLPPGLSLTNRSTSDCLLLS